MQGSLVTYVLCSDCGTQASNINKRHLLHSQHDDVLHVAQLGSSAAGESTLLSFMNLNALRECVFAFLSGKICTTRVSQLCRQVVVMLCERATIAARSSVATGHP